MLARDLPACMEPTNERDRTRCEQSEADLGCARTSTNPLRARLGYDIAAQDVGSAAHFDPKAPHPVVTYSHCAESFSLSHARWWGDSSWTRRHVQAQTNFCAPAESWQHPRVTGGKADLCRAERKRRRAIYCFHGGVVVPMSQRRRQESMHAPDLTAIEPSIACTQAAAQKKYGCVGKGAFDLG